MIGGLGGDPGQGDEADRDGDAHLVAHPYISHKPPTSAKAPTA